MKNIFFIILTCIALFFTGCKKNIQPQESAPVRERAQGTTQKTPKAIKGNAIMDFNKEIHDFGTIKEGDKVETIFKFTNTGTEDLLITKAKGSCGCTVPDYPKHPIKPGESGEIKVSFNSNKRTGQNTKSVSMEVNTKAGYEVLRIKANVLPKENN